MRKLVLLLIFVSFLFTKLFSAKANNILMVKNITGVGINYSDANCNDSKGNLIIAGMSNCVTNFGSGLYADFTDSTYNNSYFLAKYNQNGKPIWVKRAKSKYLNETDFSKEDNHLGQVVCVDKNDNIYVMFSMKFQNLFEWDFGNGVVLETKYSNLYAMLIKYSPDGECLWGKCISGTWGGLEGCDVAVDPNNNVYITGDMFWLDTYDFGDGVKIKNGNITSSFITKYSSDGKCQWATNILHNYPSYFIGNYNLSISDTNNIYVYGNFQVSTDFGNGKYIYPSGKPGTSFLASYTTKGKFRWVKTLGRGVFQFPIGIASDRQGGVYISGSSTGKAILDSSYFITSSYGGNNIWIARVDSIGRMIWMRFFDGQLTDYPLALNSDNKGNLFLFGATNSSTLDLGNNNVIMTPNSLISVFVAKFDSSGESIWCNYGNLKKFPGWIAYPQVPFINSKQLSLDSSGNAYTVLYFSDTLTLANGTNLITKGLDDIFIIRYGNNCEEYSISYNDFSNSNGLNFTGKAVQDINQVKLTPNSTNLSGGIWYQQQQSVSEGFNTEFTFSMTDGYNDFEDGSAPGADGIAFVIQNSDPNIIGLSGGGLGFENIPNSLAIEIDTYRNSDSPYNDPDGNHLAVFSNGRQPNKPYHNSNSDKGSTSNIIPILANGTKYHCKIEYDRFSGILKIYLDSTGKFSTPSLVIDSLKLSSLLDLSAGSNAWVGFTSSTGTSKENHFIDSWYFCSVQTLKLLSVPENHSDHSADNLMIIPNPASDNCEINYRINNKTNISLCLVDQFGQQIELLESGDKLPGNYSKTISLGRFGLADGLYFIYFKTNDNILSKKMLLIR